MNATALLTAERDLDHTLVVVFLRGAADGLHLVVPYGDDAYYRARPTIGMKRSELVDLDGFFGLHPSLIGLHEFWKEGRMSIVHGVGSEDESRSHFDAQDFMEHGGLTAGGWLGRFLRVRPDSQNSPLTAVAIGARLPECLRGAPSCAAIQSFESFGLGRHADAQWNAQLAELYRQTPGMLGLAGAQAFTALQRMETLRGQSYQPSHNAIYAADPFSQGMLQIARLLKARVGLQAATINLDGWDSHLTQSTIIDGPIRRLGAGLASFARDLGADHLKKTTVVVMTEFGRRVAENSAGGTDHGLGSVMFVLGGNQRGGRVHAQWTGLDPEKLAVPGDLPVRYNYRNILATILRDISSGTSLREVFPDFSLEPLILS